MNTHPSDGGGKGPLATRGQTFIHTSFRQRASPHRNIFSSYLWLLGSFHYRDDQSLDTPPPYPPPPRPPLVSKPPPPKSTGMINGEASLSQPPQLPVSPKHTFSSTSLFPFLGSSHPPQDNRCCCLESRALRKHESKTSCAQTISQYVLLNSAYENMFY